MNFHTRNKNKELINKLSNYASKMFQKYCVFINIINSEIFNKNMEWREK